MFHKGTQFVPRLLSTTRRNPLPLTTFRPLATTYPLLARKGAEDKDSLQPRRSEYSQTGGDDAGAESSAAFDPNTTSPEGEKAQAKQDKGGDEKKNPLDVSPGNAEVSKPRKNDEGGPANSPRTSSSGGGGAPKAGGGKSG